MSGFCDCFMCLKGYSIHTCNPKQPIIPCYVFLRTGMSTHHNWFHAQPGDEEEHNKSTGRLDRQDPKKIGQVQPISLFRSIGFSVSASQNLGFFFRKKKKLCRCRKTSTRFPSYIDGHWRNMLKAIPGAQPVLNRCSPQRDLPALRRLPRHGQLGWTASDVTFWVYPFQWDLMGLNGS